MHQHINARFAMDAAGAKPGHVSMDELRKRYLPDIQISEAYLANETLVREGKGYRYSVDVFYKVEPVRSCLTGWKPRNLHQRAKP